jgi:hypothetical protein
MNLFWLLYVETKLIQLRYGHAFSTQNAYCTGQGGEVAGDGTAVMR